MACNLEHLGSRLVSGRRGTRGARGRPEEFAEFAGAVARELRGTALLMCGDWHRAEDAIQEALMRLYVAWPRLERGGGLRRYARMAVISVVLDQGKRPWRRERAVDDLPLVSIPDASTAVDDRRAVLAALSGLPDRQRACVVLRYYADLSVEETAAILDITPGTVKSQTSRGLASLQSSRTWPISWSPQNGRP
ncbi:MAG: SigE family RNA polymerase sigma factor [Lapillicoccus sp.]